MSIPRAEHPEPQFQRAQWLNLNGEWECEIDISGEGKERKFYERERLDGKIIVPFCPESKLSGVGYTGFMNAVWYRRDLTIPKSFAGKRILLHFGAVDHVAHVYINGTLVGSHTGGYTPFAFDITDHLKKSVNSLTVLAEDDLRYGGYGAGKQSKRLESHGCFYTRTTGIWQTVWIEAVDSVRIDSVRLTPQLNEGSVLIEAPILGGKECTLTASASFGGKPMGERTVKVSSHAAFDLKLSEIIPWELGKGNLYDLTLTLKCGDALTDEVKSYFGLRSVELKDGKFYLNGRSVFGRFILDQGFYPDGIYTAPDAKVFDDDVKKAMDLGYNGARFHEKICEPLAIYAADRAGYMIWGEYPDWGMSHHDIDCLKELVPDWIDEVNRDYSRPSIIGWCCLNETWDRTDRRFRQDDEVLRVIYRTVKSLDRTRPVIDTSGNYHVITDTFDVHCYEQNPELMRKNFSDNDGIFVNFADRQQYNGTPYWVSEYGGIKLPGESEGWGYGDAPKTRKEFLDRYKGLADALLDNEKCWALCYTQLTDVEQEENGLYRYDRTDKFTKEEKEFLRAALIRKAAVED